MSATFVGRKRELAALEQAWKAERSGFIPIYGRRRVGKSELIIRFLADKPAIYCAGKVAPPELQRREFLRSAALALGEPWLADHPVPDWPSAFRLVEERRKRSVKLIIALDEFQWMAAASLELPSVLQECWDRRWRERGFLPILCGSYLVFVDFSGLCSADVYPVRVKSPKLDLHFVKWSFVAEPFTEYANRLSGRTRMPKLNRKQLFGFGFTHPPLHDQRRIVAELDALQAEVDALKRLQAETAAELDALLPAVLHRAFNGHL